MRNRHFKKRGNSRQSFMKFSGRSMFVLHFALSRDVSRCPIARAPSDALEPFNPFHEGSTFRAADA